LYYGLQLSDRELAHLFRLLLWYLWLLFFFLIGNIVILVEDLRLLVVLGGRFFFRRLPELLEDALVLFEEGVV
jgi:hypothetical protein